MLLQNKKKNFFLLDDCNSNISINNYVKAMVSCVARLPLSLPEACAASQNKDTTTQTRIWKYSNDSY